MPPRHVRDGGLCPQRSTGRRYEHEHGEGRACVHSDLHVWCCLTDSVLLRGTIIDAAGARSEQGRFLNNSPGSSNARLGDPPCEQRAAPSATAAASEPANETPR